MCRSFAAFNEIEEDDIESGESVELNEIPPKPSLPSVSSALVLGTALGLAEAVILMFCPGPILTAMGVNAVGLCHSI